MGFRVSEEDEVTGIDETEHAETAYDFSTLRGGGTLSGSHSAVNAAPVAATAGKES